MFNLDKWILRLIALLVAARLAQVLEPTAWAIFATVALYPIIGFALIGLVISWILFNDLVHNRLVKEDLARTIANERKKSEARLR